jgi:SPP1 family predicted phage head-tail adaptor
MSLPAGRLDRRIFVQHATVTQDAAGQRVATYAGGIHVWAHVKYENGNFDVIEKKDTKVNKAHFTIRYLAPLAISSRIQFEGKNYLIEDIQTIGRNEFQKIITEERS